MFTIIRWLVPQRSEWVLFDRTTYRSVSRKPYFVRPISYKPLDGIQFNFTWSFYTKRRCAYHKGLTIACYFTELWPFCWSVGSHILSRGAVLGVFIIFSDSSSFFLNWFLQDLFSIWYTRRKVFIIKLQCSIFDFDVKVRINNSLASLDNHFTLVPDYCNLTCHCLAKNIFLFWIPNAV